MKLKKYWSVNTETKEVNQNEETACFMGGIYHIPCDALLVRPLPKKINYAVIAKDDLSGSYYIEDYRGRIVYSKNDSNIKEEIKELGSLPKGFTLKEPTYEFSKWDINSESWVRDIQSENEYNYKLINENRRYNYSVKVDSLLNEASIKRLLGCESEAEELERRAIKERQNIQQMYPWPLEVKE